MLCEIINPKSVQCYAEESQIGSTTLVYKGSMAGRYERGVQKVVLSKRELGLFVRYEPEGT